MSDARKHINPLFKHNSRKLYTLQECINGLRSSEVKVLSYLISKSESAKKEDEDFVLKVLQSVKPNDSVRRLAISGSPGVGKSTFINSFGKFLVENGKRIAVLPVDPTSQISQGSILGDKTRMDELINEQNAYIKPMASSLALGGLAPSTYVAMQICERAGFDYIILETVGVGQSEFEARHMVDMFLLLLQPGGGDNLQGIKRGIMEMADLFVITKADGQLKDNAKRTYREYQNAMQLMSLNKWLWEPQAHLYSAIEHEGRDAVYKTMNAYFKYLEDNEYLSQLRSEQDQRYFSHEYKTLLLEHAFKSIPVSKKIEELNDKMRSKEILPLQALYELRITLDGLE